MISMFLFFAARRMEVPLTETSKMVREVGLCGGKGDIRNSVCHIKCELLNKHSNRMSSSLLDKGICIEEK